MSEVRRVLLANGQYIEIVQETGSSTGAVMSQNAVTAALNGKANSSHNHTASNITGGTFSSARIADGAITSGKLATNAVVNAKIADGAVTSGKLAANSVTTAKVVDGAITKAKLASDVLISMTSFENISITGKCGDASSISGKRIMVNGAIYVFDMTGVINVAIPYGCAYNVRPMTYNGYYSNDIYFFTASTASRSITVNYKNFAYGYYIQATTGELYTAANWQTTTNLIPNGIAGVYEDESILIALHDSPTELSIHSTSADYSTWQEVVGCYSRVDYTEKAIGTVQTEKIYSIQPSTDYAAGYCKNYTFPDGYTHGYLPTYYELLNLSHNDDTVNTLLEACGGTKVYYKSPRAGYYSSTLYCGDEEGRMETFVCDYVGHSGTTYTTSTRYVRPFARI